MNSESEFAADDQNVNFVTPEDQHDQDAYELLKSGDKSPTATKQSKNSSNQSPRKSSTQSPPKVRTPHQQMQFLQAENIKLRKQLMQLSDQLTDALEQETKRPQHEIQKSDRTSVSVEIANKKLLTAQKEYKKMQARVTQTSDPNYKVGVQARIAQLKLQIRQEQQFKHQNSLITLNKGVKLATKHGIGPKDTEFEAVENAKRDVSNMMEKIVKLEHIKERNQHRFEQLAQQEADVLAVEQKLLFKPNTPVNAKILSDSDFEFQKRQCAVKVKEANTRVTRSRLRIVDLEKKHNMLLKQQETLQQMLASKHSLMASKSQQLLQVRNLKASLSQGKILRPQKSLSGLKTARY